LPVEGSSALTAAFGTEGADITDSVPASNALNKVTLTAERLAGYAESSLEAVQDSAASILDFVLTVLTEKSGREIDKQVLEGTGSPFTGLSGNSSVNELATAANGDAISYAILSEMVYKARERASRDNAHFFVAPEIMQKITGLVDSTGQPIFRFGSVPQAIPSTLLGFPVEVHSVIKADRTYGTGTGHSNLYFGPPSAVVVGNRVPMSWDTAREGALFKSYGIAMRLVMRVGAAIAVPKAFTRKIQVKAV
jgi:HK97 family phage major capsid protein